MAPLLGLLFVCAVFVAVGLLSGVRVYAEYERAVIFRLGRARKNLAGPGVTFLLPFGLDRAKVVDVRTKAIQIPPQEVITRDNISMLVDAVVYAYIASPRHAVLEVEQYLAATLQLASTTLRAVLGKMDMDDILAHRDGVNQEVRRILDERTEQWGVDITAVELRDIELPSEMKRAMARQAEAERERRAKVIAADGEVQAAAKLAQAATIIADTPAALQLRLYQTLVEISGEANQTIVFPLPIELLPRAGGAGGAPAAGDTNAAQTMMASALSIAGAAAGRAMGSAPPAPALAPSVIQKKKDRGNPESGED
jgi:regulator of protease activity HflC (stomatin/prohibitin superfamily)